MKSSTDVKRALHCERRTADHEEADGTCRSQLRLLAGSKGASSPHYDLSGSCVESLPGHWHLIPSDPQPCAGLVPVLTRIARDTGRHCTALAKFDPQPVPVLPKAFKTPSARKQQHIPGHVIGHWGRLSCGSV